MPTYKIGLARTYLVTVQAEDPETAKRLTEFFVSESDISIPIDRQENNFAIEEIELIENDAFECDNV